ncbi:oxygen-independent coproporphyrinogen III oxidase [uncultured Thiohalocapsa sp.]|uniref:oxygen-independent coproporphyrinogen III oxidase n=1 Tax=uncultured Thiohalocapsa sp. TaxID=768990 RepID=UPI0025CF469B|nr:oxygen-independent coproporphyrinogen III oxidase [uncultured Thiohalocapsa sp.]
MPRWVDGYGAEDYAQDLAAIAQRPSETLSLHVHIPFCAGRCLYCGCNTTVTHDSARMDAYLDALDREMALVAERIDGNRDVLQVHLAGGTPNYLSEAQLTRLTEMLERRFHIVADTECSIECDPRRSSAGQLELLHALGFRSIGFGVQDLDADVQRAIGRIQSEELIRDVYWMAREIGFDSIGFDLIYGLPQQTAATFDRTLDTVLELAPDRVACFGYARRTLSGPHQHAIDVHELPDNAERERLFRTAVSAFTQAGYAWIGLDTFALETDDLALAQADGRLHRNCIGYTATPSAHVAGLGAGAIGELQGTCVQNQLDLEGWRQEVHAGRMPVDRGRRLSALDRRRRDAISHLICNLELPYRMADGCLDDEYRRLAAYAGDGLVEVWSQGLRVTEAGRFFLRELCTEHDADFHWDRARWHFSPFA